MEKRVSFPVSEEEHQALKILAAKEKISVKVLVLAALDNTHPEWRNKGENIEKACAETERLIDL